MKVLILSAATGGGHLRAAQAVQTCLREYEPSWRVEVVDALKCVGSLLDKTCCDGYRFLATKTPKVFGQLYRATNEESVLNTLMTHFSGLLGLRLLPMLREQEPDLILSTHPFATEMISHLKEKGLVQAPLICLMTDYGPHRAWIAPRVDAYVVSNEDMLPEMVEMGAPRDIIYPFGIPVDNVFFSKENKAALLQEMGLEPGVPTILFMAGSFGVSGIMDIYREIAAQDIVFQIIVITGKNQKLYEAFAVELAKSKRRTKLIYFTDEVEKYMHAADRLVTKPGGLTVSEALACDIPLAVFDAIPGQEEDNAQFLLSHNMAVRIRAGESCGKTIRIVLADNRRLEDMRSSCERFDKSKSGENILWLIRSLTGKEKAL